MATRKAMEEEAGETRTLRRETLSTRLLRTELKLSKLPTPTRRRKRLFKKKPQRNMFQLRRKSITRLTQN